MVPLLLWYIMALVQGDDSQQTESTSSLITIITNSNLGSDFSVNTAKTTTKSSSSTTSSSTAKDTFSSLPSSLTTENSDDKALFKMLFTRQADKEYYDIPITMSDDQVMGLRMDILQNNIWVLNHDSFLDCDTVDDWWANEENIWGSILDNASPSLPASVTTAPEYLATACAESGSLMTDSDVMENMPDSQVGYLANFQDVRVPYVNSINASGEVLTSNLSFINTNDQLVAIANFTFINANMSTVYIGGFGLAGNSLSNSGILNSLVNKNIMDSNSYSLYFNKFLDSNTSFAQVIPGIVDKKYYVGDLYSFDILDHTGQKYSPGSGYDFENSLIDYMVIPSTQLDDILIENSNTGNTISLKPQTDMVFPVIFDSRTVFNFVPLDVIVNLAMQTNAFFNAQLNRWMVECDTIRNTNALVNFKFADLTVKVPIDDLLLDAVTSTGAKLTFTNGVSACYLNFLPTETKFSTLGLPFLQSVYLAVDNVGGTIGLANANKQLSIPESDYLPLDNGELELYNATEHSPNANLTVGLDSSTTTSVSSIGYISSDFIPFATHVNYTTDLTLTYSPYNSAAELTVPGRFSGNIITSDQILVTRTGTANSSLSLASTTSDNDGGLMKSPNMVVVNDMRVHWYWIGFMLPVIVFIL